MTQRKTTSSFKKTAAVCFRTLFIILIILVAFFVIQMVLHPDKPPSFFGYQPYTVLSNSMKPTFAAGDMIIVKKTSPSDIQVDDVITSREPGGKYITHRVVDIMKERDRVAFITKGDNNNVVDEKAVTSRAIIGKQMFSLPKAGFVVKLFSSPIGFAVLVILPLIGYLCLELYERLKKTDKKAETGNEL